MSLKAEFKYFLETLGSYFRAIKGIARKQNLTKPDASKLTFQESFYLDPYIVSKWKELFQVNDANLDIPFTYHSRTVFEVFHRLLSKLRVNFKNVLHIKSTMHFYSHGGQVSLRPGQRYNVTMSCNECFVNSSKKQVVYIVETVIKTEKKQVAVSIKDFVLIRNASETDLNRVKDMHQEKHKEDLEFLYSREGRRSKLDETYPSKKLFFEEKLGIDYGKVSGDMNIVHTNKYIVRLFGYKKIFVQGLCTANHILKILAEEHPDKLNDFEISFLNPVFLGEPAVIKYNENKYEVCNEQNRILASGQWNITASIKNKKQEAA